MDEIIEGTFTDPRDGKTYRTVKIGEQVWMAENLNFECEGSICYDKDPDNAKKYGRLYDWKTAMGAYPPGWHLPDDDEWDELINFAGGGNIAAKKLKAKSGWEDTYEKKSGNGTDDDTYDKKSGNGTDDYGFSALPGGYGYSSSAGFNKAGRNGYWWSATELSIFRTYIQEIEADGRCFRGHRHLQKYDLLSVRYIKDSLHKPHSRISARASEDWGVLYEEKAENLCRDTINQIVSLANCARQEGILALENRLENLLAVTLLHDGVQFAVDGTPQELIDVYIHYINIYTSIVSAGIRGMQSGVNPRVLRMQLNAILRENMIKDDIAKEDKELYERLRTYMDNCKYPVPKDGIPNIYFRPSDHYWCPVKNGLANDIILVDRATYHHLDKYKGQAVEELLKMEEFKKYIFDETQKLVRQEEAALLQWEKDEVLKNMLGAYISNCTKSDTKDFFDYYCIENGCLECCEKPNKNLSKLLKYRGQNIEYILTSVDFRKDMEEVYQTFTDPRDGRTYRTVKIGEQVWMAENLNYAGPNNDIGKYYDNNPANGKKYGRLYTWDEAVKACPPGCHIPSREEWDILVDFTNDDGEKTAGKKLKAKSGWKSEWHPRRLEGDGTDDYGFSALPGGSGLSDGSFSDIDRGSYWWSSSENENNYAYCRIMNYNTSRAFCDYYDKSCLRSVRCLIQ